MSLNTPPLTARRLLQLLLVAAYAAPASFLLLEYLSARWWLRYGMDETLLVLAATGLVATVVHRECGELPGPFSLLLGFFAYYLALCILVPNIRPHGGQGPLLACKSNLRNVGTALEMYSTDHGGHYPGDLAELTPNYLKTIPTCPSAGKDTYSQFFLGDPDHYTVVCGGCYHHDAGVDATNYPQYTSSLGLIERP